MPVGGIRRIFHVDHNVAVADCLGGAILGDHPEALDQGTEELVAGGDCMNLPEVAIGTTSDFQELHGWTASQGIDDAPHESELISPPLRGHSGLVRLHPGRGTTTAAGKHLCQPQREGEGKERV